MEFMRIKKGVASLALTGMLFGGTVLGVGAAPIKNGAGGVVAAAIQAITTVTNTGTIDVAVVELNNSLNNLTALNNVLNNNDIIDDITVGDINVVRIGDITVTDVLKDFLKNNDILISEVVGVAVLSGGDFIVFTR